MKSNNPPWFRQLLHRFFSSQEDALVFMAKLVKDHDIVRLPVVKKTYLINDPGAIHQILLGNHQNYTKEGTSYARLEKLVGLGMLTTYGEDWALRRSCYQAKFHTKNLQQYEDTITTCTHRTFELFEKDLSQPINISNEMLSLVMNITTQAFLGLDISERSLDLVEKIHFLNDFAVHKALTKWLPTPSNFRYYKNKKLFDDYLLSTLKSNTNPVKTPLLEDILLKDEHGNFKRSEDYILGEAKNFFVAGHETTGNAISWTLLSMLQNGYVLIKVLEEINKVIGDQTPTFESIEQLPYLDMVIQEGLRLYPPIWFFTRSAIEQDELNGYKIPANSNVNIITFLVHRHPKYWPNPHHFYPERFSPEASRDRPKCAYLPFGVGPRVCIGRQFATMTMKMILVMLLQRYNFKLPHEDYHAKLEPLITLKAVKGIRLKVELIK